MDRNQIEEKYKWDLTKIYKNIDEFNEDFNKALKEIEEFNKYETIMDNSAKDFYNTLNKYFEISRTIEKLSVYTHLLFDENTGNNKNQALSGKVSNLYDKFTKVTFFITPTILKKDYKEIEEYYKEEPKLLDYEIILKNEYRYKNHTYQI